MLKKDSKLQIYIDYRQLNDVIVKDQYPLPLISQLQDQLASVRHFTYLDLLTIYAYIRIRKRDEQKTAFRTRHRHYEYRIMPFRLTNALATFQKVVNHIIQPFLDKFIVYYLDNILIFSKTLKEHQKYIRQVLDVLYVQKLLVNKDKSKFYVIKIVFLDFKISLGQIYIELTKVEAIKIQPILTNIIEV